MQIQKCIAEFIGAADVPILASSASVAEALALMKTRNSACVLLTEDGVLVGIFTERDFLMRVAAPKLRVADTVLRDVMTSNPDALRSEDYITYAVNLMAVGGYRNVPIVDAEQRPVSNLTVYDVTSHLASIFSEVNESEDGQDEWTDIGGG